MINTVTHYSCMYTYVLNTCTICVNIIPKKYNTDTVVYVCVCPKEFVANVYYYSNN